MPQTTLGRPLEETLLEKAESRSDALTAFKLARRWFLDGRRIEMQELATALGVAFTREAAYASSKAGLIGLTRDLAQQWTPRKGIRVNALAPGYFATEMTEAFEATTSTGTSFRAPMGRLGQPNEIGAAVVYPASDASSYVTGIVLPVEGGFLTT